MVADGMKGTPWKPDRMNFNQDPNLAALGKAAKSVGVELLPICRACERNGQATWVERLPQFDSPLADLRASFGTAINASAGEHTECCVCGAPTCSGFSPKRERGVLERAFNVYYGRLNEAIQTAMKGLAAP